MEKRLYERTRIDIEGVFELSGDTNVFCEFTGIIEDISEGGIKIVVDNLSPSTDVDSIKIGDPIHFTGTDEYVLSGDNRVELVQGVAKVVRKQNEDNKVIIGCKFDPLTEELERYIKDKKTSSFLVSMNV